MFPRWDFDAGFLTTEITEAGSLGARRTPKGWESCLRINQPYKFRNTFQFFIYAFGILEWGLGCNPSYKRCKKITDELWSYSAKRTFADYFRVAQRAFPSLPWLKKNYQIGICLLDDFWTRHLSAGLVLWECFC